LITGGTSGIGLAFAEEFIRLGNKVIICGRRENRFAEIQQKHKNIVTRVCDVDKYIYVRIITYYPICQGFPVFSISK